MLGSILSDAGVSARNAWQAPFMALLPKLERQARICFRGIPCPAHRADRIAEAVGLGWKWYVRLVEQGKDVTQFPTVFIKYVTSAVKCGRRLAGQEKAREVLSPVAQHRHGFRVEFLPMSVPVGIDHHYSQVNGQGDVFEERLHDNTQTPVPDQVQFRIDFPAWLRKLTARERRIIRAMMTNESNKGLSRRFQVTSARISQLRRRFKQGWHRFCGDDGAREAFELDR